MRGSCGKRGETGSQSNRDSQATPPQRYRPSSSAPEAVAEKTEDPAFQSWILIGLAAHPLQVPGTGVQKEPLI